MDRILLTVLVIFGRDHIVIGAFHRSLPNDARWTLRSSFANGGITAVKISVKENLNDWSNTEINVAVTGNSGVGKSSFINAIRGLSPEDEGAAEVGVTETTTEIKSYLHPGDRRIILWDLTGVGTPQFPRYRYLSEIGEDRFDYFVIISSNRFTENDLWLAEQFMARGKSFYFVRSKVGQDIENDKRSHPKTHRKESVLDAIRNNCNQNLNSVFRNHRRVYLIDNYEPSQYDFGLLSERLMAEAPELKRTALRRSLTSYSRSLISDKKEDLRERISKVALASGIAGAMPVPGLDIAMDMFALLEEALHYRKEFGLDDDSLYNCANAFRMSKDRFTRDVGLRSSLIEYTTSGLLTYFAKIGLTQAASFTTSNIMKYVFPIFGNIASGITSYTATTICLNNLLDMMGDDAIKINNFELPY